MSWHLWPRRREDIPHQIRLSFGKHPRTRVLYVTVSCRCRPKGHGLNHYEAMTALKDDGESPWPYYNDPANHRGPVPFTHDMQGGPPHLRYKEDKWSTQQ